MLRHVLIQGCRAEAWSQDSGYPVWHEVPGQLIGTCTSVRNPAKPHRATDWTLFVPLESNRYCLAR